MPNKSIDLYKEIIDKSNSGVIYAIPMIEADSVLDFEIVVLNQSAKELLQVEGEVKYVGELPICVSKELSN